MKKIAFAIPPTFFCVAILHATGVLLDPFASNANLVDLGDDLIPDPYGSLDFLSILGVLCFFLPLIASWALKETAEKNTLFENFEHTPPATLFFISFLICFIGFSCFVIFVDSSSVLLFVTSVVYFGVISLCLWRLPIPPSFSVSGKQTNQNADSTESSINFENALKNQLLRLKQQTTVILILSIIVAGYAAYQASQAIDTANTGGLGTRYISEIESRIERRQRQLDGLVQNEVAITTDSLAAARAELNPELEDPRRTKQGSEQTNGSSGSVPEDNRLNVIIFLLEVDRNLRENEIKRMEVAQQNIDGPYLFSFFSRFFVRLASVLISLGFFTILFFQYRRLDRQRAELEIIRLSYKMLKDGTDLKAVESARSALAISDYIPTRRESDSLAAFGAATIGMAPSMMKEFGVRLRSQDSETDVPKQKEPKEPSGSHDTGGQASDLTTEQKGDK